MSLSTAIETGEPQGVTNECKNQVPVKLQWQIRSPRVIKYYCLYLTLSCKTVYRRGKTPGVFAKSWPVVCGDSLAVYPGCLDLRVSAPMC